MSDGEDLRGLPLSMRKASLSRLLARRVDGIFLSDFEQGEIGPDLFRHGCLIGLEGMVSKHRESTYRAGRFVAGSRSDPAASRVCPRAGQFVEAPGTISIVLRRFDGGASRALASPRGLVPPDPHLETNQGWGAIYATKHNDDQVKQRPCS